MHATRINVKSKSGALQSITPLGFQKKFKVEYTKELIIHESCCLQDSNNAIDAPIYCEQIRQAHIADIYIQKVSDDVGFGVFASGDIIAGEMIGEYTGLARKKKNSDCSNAYIFNYNSKSVIDASKRGNSMRFVNHSSLAPNAKYLRVLVDGIQHILIVAARDISAGEQILFDYGEDYWAVRSSPQEIEESVS